MTTQDTFEEFIGAFIEHNSQNYTDPTSLEFEIAAKKHMGISRYSEEDKTNGIVIFFWVNGETGRRLDLKTFFEEFEDNISQFESPIVNGNSYIYPLFITGSMITIEKVIRENNKTPVVYKSVKLKLVT